MMKTKRWLFMPVWLGYLEVLLAVLLLAGDFSLNKLYQRRAGVTPRAGLVFNLLNGGMTALLFFCVGGFTLRLSWFSLLTAAGLALLITGYTLLGFRIMKDGGLAVYTLFLMAGGMTVPYIWGLLFLGEPFTLWRTAGLAVIISAVALTGGGKGALRPRQTAMCAAVFFLNGFVSVLSKLHQIDTAHHAASSPQFVMLTGFFKCLFCGGALFFLRLREGKTELPIPCLRVSSIAFLSAAVSGCSFLLQLLGARVLPASVLYPLVTGGSVVLSTLAGLVLFREKAGKRVWAGIALCVLGTCLFL